MTESLFIVPFIKAANKVEFYLNEALRRPVGVEFGGEKRVVMISLKEYERLKRRDRQVIRTEDLDDETLDNLLNAEIPEKAKRIGYLKDDLEIG